MRTLAEACAALGPRRLTRTSPVLHDRRLDDLLRRDGYAVVRVLTAEAADVLRCRYGDLHGWTPRMLVDYQPPDFEIDFWSPDRAYRQAVSDAIADALDESLASAFVRHRPIGRIFQAKWPMAPDQPPWPGVPEAFHNDTMYVDERTGTRSYMSWVALQDIDANDGTLEVVPGSHLLPRTLRGLDLWPSWLEHQDVYRRHATSVALRAGEALVFDPAIVHRSPPNSGPRPRVVATVLLTEPGEPLIYFRNAGGDAVELVRVEDDFMVTASADELPHLPAHDTITRDEPEIDAAQLERRLGWIELGRRFGRRIGPTDRRSPVLRDASNDRQLAEDGYTVMDLIDRERCQAVLELQRRLRGTEGTGFEPDLTNPDTTYRTSVAEGLEALLGDDVRRAFADHRIFIWNFLVKWPGEVEPLYLHRDWMFVDEPQGHRSYLAWIALDDVVGDRGVLQVLPGSHRIDGELSGTGLQPEWLQHEDVVRRHLVDVPVRSGQMVVMNHALVHCSHPNRSAAPRVVAAAALCRDGVGLVHFRRTTPESADRHEVDARFFVETTPASLMERPPGSYPSTPVTTPRLDLCRAELAALLDRPPTAQRPPDGRRWVRRALGRSVVGRDGRVGAGPAAAPAPPR